MTSATKTINQQNLPANIGRFIPLQCLGKGGQGIVYLASDPELGRDVAIKTMLRKGKDPTRLFNEARNVSKLHHTNIVPLYEMGVDNEVPYLVYQYARGVPLSRILCKQQPLPVLKAIKIICKLLDAIDCAHKQSIIHKDLSTANILIDAKDEPYILDFGISAILGDNSSADAIVGNVSYMAPEFISNADAGPFSDLFSLSVVLHEMLTGHLLFAADNQMATMYKIVNEEIAPPSTFNKAIDHQLDEIVMRGLAKNPHDRYADALEMKAHLEHYSNPENRETGPRELGTDGAGSGALNFLLRRMARKPDFPAISHTITEITEKSSGDATSVDELANIILKDFALTGKLLRLVNSSMYGHYGGKITTVSRAVVILGFEQVRTAALSILLFDHLSQGEKAADLANAACSSFLSAIMAKELAGIHPTMSPEHAFVSAVFHRLGRHLVIYYFPEEYVEIQDLTCSQGLDEKTATTSVVGVTYAELGIAISRKWKLPEEIITSMHPPPRGLTSRPRNVEELMGRIAGFCNEVSETAATCEPDHLNQTLEEISTRYRQSFRIGAADIRIALQGSLAELSQYAEVLNLDRSDGSFLGKLNYLQIKTSS